MINEKKNNVTKKEYAAPKSQIPHHQNKETMGGQGGK